MIGTMRCRCRARRKRTGFNAEPTRETSATEETVGIGKRIELKARGIHMLYKKINIELVILADEAEPVVAELNAALDQLEEKHTLFGGEIETIAFDHPGTRKRSALAHTLAAGKTAMRTTRESLTVALRAVI
jgi:hypothetical protein